MIGYIYIIENLKNNKKYIGQTINIKKKEYEKYLALDSEIKQQIFNLIWP